VIKPGTSSPGAISRRVGVRHDALAISTGAEDQGEEVDDWRSACTSTSGTTHLQEVWDIGSAILAYVSQAELADSYVRGCLEGSGPVAAV